MTISLDGDLDRQIRQEADRDGVDVSTWMARVARTEATRRSYTAAAAQRHAAGIYSEEWQQSFADRRAAMSRFRAGR